MAPLVGKRGQRIEVIVVIKQKIRMHVVGRALHVGATAFSLLRINMHPAVVYRCFLHGCPIIAKNRHRGQGSILTGFQIKFFIERYERRINIVVVELFHTQHASSQFEITMQCRQCLVYFFNQRVIHL